MKNTCRNVSVHSGWIDTRQVQWQSTFQFIHNKNADEWKCNKQARVHGNNDEHPLEQIFRK